MQKAIENVLMFYWNYGITDTAIEDWDESKFNQTMTFLVSSYE